MQRLLVAVVLSAVLGTAHAGVYKWVDADGNITYSDRPQPGAEEVDVGSVQTYEAPSLPAPGPSSVEKAVVPSYEVFAVVTPTDDETLRDNGGTVPVSLKISPGLGPDHSISIFMDGKDLGGDGRTTSLTLEDVDRGSHTIYAAVLDGDGKQVARTDPVTFHLHRTSRLIKPKANPPSP